MELALIDDDSLYQSVFKEFFDNLDIQVHQFSRGKDFINSPADELGGIKCVVIDHTILDTTIPELTKAIQRKIGAEVCIISTFGEASKEEKIKDLGISGDFKKLDLKSVLSWYVYFRGGAEKKLHFSS